MFEDNDEFPGGSHTDLNTSMDTRTIKIKKRGSTWSVVLSYATIIDLMSSDAVIY